MLYIKILIALKFKDGGINRYIYYGCTKNKNHNCKCGYVREEELINQLLSIINKLSIDKIGIREKIEKEIERYHKFQFGVLGIKKEKEIEKEINVKSYAKYILKQGTIIKKRELLSSLKTKLILKNKMIRLEK